MNLAEFSVKNRVLANVLFFVVLIVGLITTMFIQRELFPTTDLDLIVIATPYPGALPEEVENHVTIPIEDELKGMNGIDEFTSSSVEGLSAIQVTLDPDIGNKERVISDILRKVDRVRFDNDRIEDPDIEVIVTREMAINVSVGGTLPEADLREYAGMLETKISRIDNVGTIIKSGWRDPEIWIEVDAEALAETELSILAVSDALRAHNVNFPGGKIPSGSSELMLRTTGQFSTLEDIREVVVRSNPDGMHLTVGDISRVTHNYAENQVRLRANGERAIMLSVEKKTKGDTIDIADEVKELVEQEREILPEGITISVFDFESFVIKRRLRVLLSNGFCGLILVLLSLPLLMNMRVAIVTALGIPFAFLTALLVMAYLGISVNMLTMFAMILVVGMLVDDAIIMAENIFRHLEAGEEPEAAAIKGAKEVMWPVTATVLTTIAAFLPLAFLPGIMGKFMFWIPIVVMITLAASLFEALVILPCHVADLAQPLEKSKGRRKTDHGGRGSRFAARLQERYESFLRRVLRHRIRFLSIALLLFVGSVTFAVLTMEVKMFPPDLIDIFSVNITAHRGSTLDATEEIAMEVERRLRAELTDEELDNILTEVGHIRDQHMAKFQRGSVYSQVWVYLSPAQKRAKKKHCRGTDEIMDLMREICSDIEVERMVFEKVKPGPPTGKEVDVRVVGKDMEVLDEAAERLKQFLVEADTAQDVADSYEDGKDEIRITPDVREAARLGVSSDVLASALYAAFYGAEATNIRDAKEETVVRVKLPDDQRTIDNMLRLKVPNARGRLVSLGSVTAMTRTRGTTVIGHFDGDRSVSVTAGLKAPGGADEEAGDGIMVSIKNWFRRIASRAGAMIRRMKSGEKKVTVESVNNSLEEQFDKMSADYPGYRLVKGGEFEANEETKTHMLRAFGIALILIYGILIVQFRSIVQPWAILIAIPFGLIGVVLALFVHGKPISFMAMLGMVGMTGVVVNDAIVLVSFINDLRKRGIEAHEAVVQAAVMRLRPILLTSVTTVLGLAPVIYGLGGYEPFVAPAAIVLAYGLVFATFLTLLLVPCVYSIGIDLKARFGIKG